jgi:hypothetical protein
MMPKTTEQEPKRTKRRGLPTSNRGPHVIGEAQRKKDVSVPIQLIEKLDVVGRRVPL